jgi:hypothetical protein
LIPCQQGIFQGLFANSLRGQRFERRFITLTPTSGEKFPWRTAGNLAKPAGKFLCDGRRVSKPGSEIRERFGNIFCELKETDMVLICLAG